MRVSQAIDWLSELDPEDDIIIQWWDKDWIDNSHISEEGKLTDEQWEEVTDRFDNDGEFVITLVADKIEEIAREVMEDN